MSILIKGMEMPTGNECLILTIYPDGQCFEHVYNGSFGSREERKAVPVPPHRRLIDADELAELCDIMADKCGGIGESIWGQFKATVEWSPTIIEAEK